MPATNIPGFTTASGTGDIVGSSANYYSPAYGGVPVVPDPVSSQNQAITGNIANLGDLYNLAGSVNAFGAGQARGQYEANLPGYDAMTAQASKDITANLEGVVPPDVINQLQQGAAERGIASGVGPGSANAGAQYLKALGLTSLGQETLGQQQLTSAIQRTPTSPLFNVASMMTSPNDEQAARMAANMYAAAPNPAAAAQQAMQNALAGLKAGAGGGGTGGVNLAGAGGAPATATPGAVTTPYTTGIYPGTGPTGGSTLLSGSTSTAAGGFPSIPGTTDMGGGGMDLPYDPITGQTQWTDGGDQWTWEDYLNDAGGDSGLVYSDSGGSYDPYYGE